MTPNGDLDRRLSAWLNDEAAPRAPDDLHVTFTEGIAAARQRPSWATTERWISMETRARLGIVPRAVVILATLALLAALAAGAIVIGASSGPRLPEPFGLAGAGNIAYAYGQTMVILDADGAEQMLIRNGDAVVTKPEWSRDGSRLAYWTASSDEGPWDLMVANADGTDAHVIAAGEADTGGFRMSWSPDGSSILYEQVQQDLVTDDCAVWADGQFCGSRLFVVRTDGSGVSQVGDPALDARAGDWSPDGTLIVFGGSDPSVCGSYGCGQDDHLYLMAADGSNVRQLGDASGHAWAFVRNTWSPDGTRIATQTCSALCDIAIVDAATGAVAQLVDDSSDKYVPKWSPDGSMVAFFRGNVLAVVDASGGEPATVASFVGDFVWSPDGTSLLLTGQRTADGKPAMTITDLDGNVLREIEVPGPDDVWMSWQRVAT